MTPDELKSMPKGQFVVMKTGFYPMQVKLKLFFQWGITFGKEYRVEEKGNRRVAYAGKEELMDAIIGKYPRDWFGGDVIPPDAIPAGGQAQGMRGAHRTLVKAGERKKGGNLRTTPRVAEMRMAETGITEMKKPEAEIWGAGIPKRNAAEISPTERRKQETKTTESNFASELPVHEIPWDILGEMEVKEDGKD